MNSINASAIKQLASASTEIQDALIELSNAAQDYEKRRKIAQHKLTLAHGKLSTLVSMINPEA
jgi:hypothetical protein